MPRVMMTCPWDGKEIYTGVELPFDAAITRYARHNVICPHCGRTSPVRLPYFDGTLRELNKYHVALDSARDFAAEIGIFISCFALVEGYLDDLMAKLTGIDERDAWTILGRHQVGERLQLLAALASLRHDTDPERVAIERLLPRITNAIAARNKYAHSQYAITFNDGIVVSSWLYDSKRTRKEVTENLDSIVLEVETIKALINDLHGYIWRNEMPPPLPGKN
jgi:hypothetical protein